MPDYEQTTTVDAEPDELFDYLADVRHLPEYFPVMLDAKLAGEDEVEVQLEADPAGVRRARGWLHVDGPERRMEWGATDGPYHGWLQVDPGDVAGSLLTIHLFLGPEQRLRGGEDDAGLAAALDNIRRLVAAGAA